MHVGFAAGYTGIPLLAKNVFDASVWQLALLGVTGTLTYTVACLGLKGLVGRARPVLVALVGALLYGISYIFAIFAANVLHLMVILFFAAAASALFWPMLEAAIAEGAAGYRLNRRMGLFCLCWSTGDVLGAVLGGAVVSSWFLAAPRVQLSS